MREAMVQVKGIKKVSVLKQTQKTNSIITFRNTLSKEEVTMHSLACHIDNPEQKRTGHVY